VRRGRLDAVDHLLRRGADPDAGYPVALAARRGDVAAVRLMLTAGADPRPPTLPGGDTPAEAARFHDHLDVAAALDGARRPR
jgi:ankyrin repeat protein